MAEPSISTGSVALLCPDDLKFAPGEGPPRRLRCRLVTVDVRNTQHGQSWATLDLSWRGRPLRAVVFPSQWRALRAVRDVEVGHDYVVIGCIAFREGEPVLKVLELHEQVLHLVTSDGVGVGR
jgi:deoxyinosine 3'endonuclease (endonuclease V)